jgi:hypothetical protein
MQLGINNQILILGSQKEKTSLRKAARGLKMGDKPGHRPTNTGDDSRLPVPECDRSPILTQFVNDVGDFYNQCFTWPFNPVRCSSQRERIFAGIAKYLNDSFIETLRRELKLPKK